MLKLRKKHPEVLDSNKNRRFNINFQKKKLGKGVNLVV
jgi:hypothetical protein